MKCGKKIYIKPDVFFSNKNEDNNISLNNKTYALKLPKSKAILKPANGKTKDRSIVKTKPFKFQTPLLGQQERVKDCVKETYRPKTSKSGSNSPVKVSLLGFVEKSDGNLPLSENS